MWIRNVDKTLFAVLLMVWRKSCRLFKEGYKRSRSLRLPAIMTRGAPRAAFIFIAALTIITMAFSTLVRAETTGWDFGVPGDYTLSSAEKLEISGNTTRLRAQEYLDDDNTQALWHLNDDLNDSSGNANTLTATGSPSYAAAKFNNGLSLNGTTQYAQANDSDSLTLGNNFTLEEWFKPNASFSAGAAQDQPLLDKGNYRTYLDKNTGKLTFEAESTSTKLWQQHGGTGVNSSWSDPLEPISYAWSGYELGGSMYVGLAGSTSDAEVWQWNGSTWTKIGGDGVNSGWGGTYEYVYSLTGFNGNLIAALGSNSGEEDAEVWQWNGSTWTKIGGDGVNSSWSSATDRYNAVYSVGTFGTDLIATVGHTGNSTSAEVWKWDSSIWTKIGGDGLNSGWTGHATVTSQGVYSGALLVGLGGLGGGSANDAEVWSWNGSAWTKIGGDGTNSSWNTGYEGIESLTVMGSDLYAGLGASAGDAEVWKLTGGGAWARIGGDAVNSSWTDATYERVRGLTSLSGTIYASLGDSSGDAEVWSWNGTAWTKIGGDGVNSSWSTYVAYTVFTFNSALYAGVGYSGGDGEVWSWNGTTWTKFGGDFIGNSWTDKVVDTASAIQALGDDLYIGTGDSSGDAMVWKYNDATWTKIGGDGVNSSWPVNTYDRVYSLAAMGSDLYAGLGDSTGDAEVWKYSGGTWSQIGGDSLNSGWTSSYESVTSLMVVGTDLYAGVGNSSTDGEVWRFRSGSWAEVGGDSINGSWSTGYEIVVSMTSVSGDIYVGLSASTNDADVWKLAAGGAWSQVGGDGLNSSWNTNFEYVYSLTTLGSDIYAGLGSSDGDAEVWRWNGSAWTKIGGDTINSSWADSTYNYVLTMVAYDGKLYAGMGGDAGECEVWVWDGTSWSQIGGDGLNGGWSGNYYVRKMAVWKGKLRAGLYANGTFWSYGANTYLASSTSSWDTNWHHMAVTYDGTTLKILVDGVEQASQTVSLSVADNSSALLLGRSDAKNSSEETPFFAGMIDEARVSNTARSSVNATLYANTAQTVRPNVAFGKTGSSAWTGFSASETLNGGTIKYRLSGDEGATWYWWNGAAWTQSFDLTQVNLASDINGHINTFNVGDNGLMWQAILLGDGTQQVTLNSVTLTYSGDVTAPTNPTTTVGKNQLGGSTTLNQSDWYNYPNPSFTWSGAADASGIKGYYVYFGDSATENPQTGGTWQTGATYTYAGAGLTTDTTYYLRVRAKDNANNVFAGAAEDYTLFTYKFDSTTPSSSEYINVSPTGCSKGPTYSFTWPAPTDSHGIANYKYKVGPNGTEHTTTEISVSGISPYQEGDNTFYLKAIDTANNESGYWQTAVFCYEPSASITEGPNIEAKPSSITVTWVTDKESTGYVKVTQGNTYVSEQGLTEYTRSHEVRVVGLNSNEEYQYQLRWVDRNGNIEESDVYTTSTTEPPRVTGFQVTEVRQTSAIVTFSTTVAAKCILEHGEGADYGKEVNLGNDYGTSFAYKLEGLDAGKTYHIGITATDEDDLVFESSDYQFDTLPFPEIDNVTFEQDKGAATTTYKVGWETNIKTSSAVKYGPSGGTQKTVSSPEMALTHELTIGDLADQTNYSVSVTGRDEYGNEAQSNTQTLTTPLDTRPPKISDIVIESSANNGASETEGKSQMVVSWRTDEPSTSAVEYAEGMEGNDYTGKTPEDGALTTFHVVVVRDLSPSKPYHLRTVSADKAGNKTKSGNQVVISGKPSRSVLQIIIRSLTQAFSWIGSVGEIN